MDYKVVQVMSRHGKSTCFSVATDPDMPSAEVVACALLQLKNNPKLFKKWRKQPGVGSRRTGRCSETYVSQPEIRAEILRLRLKLSSVRRRPGRSDVG